MSDTDASQSQSPLLYESFNDPLHLSNSDQPVLQLVSTQFSGKNFLNWKRDVYLAFVAKNKECFIDGTSKRPEKNDKTYHQWIRCDLLVMKWIQHSLDQKIRDSLSYVTNAKDLWTEILERYGQTNGIEIYQLKKDLGDIHQGTSSLVEYYSGLKRAWENIDSLDPLPMCSCGALDLCNCKMLKRIVDRESNSKLIQFLMRLSSQYETVKTHILSMEPLPSLNKALSLLQKFEMQKQISDAVDVLEEPTAYAAGKTLEASAQVVQSDSAFRGNEWKKRKVEPISDEIRCNYCHNLGHTKFNCLKLKDCGYCGKKGHSREVCYKLKNDSNGGRYGRGRGRNQYSTGRHTYRRGAHNVDVIHNDGNEYGDEFAAHNDPRTGFDGYKHNQLDDNMFDGLVDKVIKAISERSPCISSASAATANFAGPFK